MFSTGRAAMILLGAIALATACSDDAEEEQQRAAADEKRKRAAASTAFVPVEAPSQPGLPPGAGPYTGPGPTDDPPPPPPPPKDAATPPVDAAVVKDSGALVDVQGQ